MLILGIDPGATGAAALIDNVDGSAIRVEDLDSDPAVVVQRLDSLLARSLAGLGLRAILERAQAMPKQGVVGVAHYMTGYGVILGWLCTRGIAYDTVPPGTWKRSLGLGSDKGAALALARRLFPAAPLERKKDHNRAEALLLAEWARRARFPKGDAP